MTAPTTTTLRCLALESAYQAQPKAGDLEYPKIPGLFFYYTRAAHISPDSSPHNPVAKLQELGWIVSQLPHAASIENWKPEKGHLYLYRPANPADAATLFTHLRKLDDQDHFKKCCCGFLLPATAWDLLISRPLGSNLLGQRELLIWNSVGLDSAAAWPADPRERDHQAWLGAGWAGQWLREEAGRGTEYPHPDHWEERLRTSLDWLVRADAEVAAYLTGSPDRDAYNRRAGQAHLRALCQFIPARLVPHFGKVYPVIGDNPGRPLPWQGTLVDQRLNMHLRQLLLDGWVIPWQGLDDQVRLQPASLALLYWAAKRYDCHFPHTETPEAFLKHYGWADDPNWFGGYWHPRSEPPPEVAGSQT
ncbi:MAG: hypothetical protein A2286_13120 [Gammaproteobacteria bacterium RIFOXYA12_FULL_61_12]|nr:MAG: hypothetical protein A2514_01440 [Gammaproteobacteria bacterium RIFOXYD12_FULL_61_37]OGT93357.1 MAG: hypothetical protein A2286_13120 [Gammaproteobacteria bacterium RIFOXYA12_FULL_61_12]